jgi:hypothetical protein
MGPLPLYKRHRVIESVLNGNIIAPGEICQVIDMVSFLQAEHVRKELRTCLS